MTEVSYTVVGPANSNKFLPNSGTGNIVQDLKLSYDMIPVVYRMGSTVKNFFYTRQYRG